MLRMQMKDHFGEKAKAMPDAVLLPLGRAAAVFAQLAQDTPRTQMARSRRLWRRGIPASCPRMSVMKRYVISSHLTKVFHPKYDVRSLRASSA
ncbi:hypothetical protein WK29_00560 [Burkholderia vietnamiensis]|nr:hypothetical protein WK29_00560 [Burkholderia vietnamiensis]